VATIEEAQRLIDAGHAFAAHEALEAAWKSAVADERDFWQGLAQLAVGLTHAQRGNAKGAVALLRRGADRIAPYGDQDPYGVPIGEVAEQAHSLAASIDEHGVSAYQEARLRLR
jgi:predicted metal-dependent hydrolase